VILSGISNIENERDWVRKTSRFYEGVYNDDGVLIDADVGIEIESIKAQDSRRSQRDRRLNGSATDGRVLQSDSSLEVIYTQTTTYRSTGSTLTINEIVLMPLSTPTLRDQYVGELKELEGYEQLTEVSEISITSKGAEIVAPAPAPTPKSGLGGGAIAGIVCGSLAFVVLVLGFAYYQYSKNREDDVDQGNTAALSGTQEGQSASGGAAGTNASLPTYGDTSVATVDYDYSRAYGGAGNHSLSDAGGTLGSRTRQTAAEDVASGLTSGTPSMHQPPGSSGNTVFSDDPTFDRAYEDVREELLDIYAPAGKLGVVIDTPDDGAPVVHAVKDTSPIAEKVQVGDKLVAVDDEDVRAMTAIKVSKLISRKSNNASRKLTIIRHVSNH